MPQLAALGAASRSTGRAGRPGAALAVTAVATAVALMNYTAPMLTLPDMAAAFATPASAQAWLLNGTPLGLAVLLLVAGSLADAHGRRRVFLLGTLTLGLTTALGAFAGSTLTFTAARIAQGAASAAVLAGSLGLLAHAYPAGRDRIRATGIWGASVSGGIALGPLLAGALSLADWRLAYGVLGAAALATAAVGARTLTADAEATGARTPTTDEAGARTPPTDAEAVEARTPRAPGPAPERSRPDIAGAVALGLALAALLTALTLGRDGWLRAPVGLLLLGSAALTALFVLVERRSRAPMVDLALLRRPAFLASTLGALFTGLAVIGLFSVVPALLQGGAGMSPLGAAGLFLLWSGTAFVAALQARRLAGRLSAPYQLALGFALSAVGVLALLGGLEGPWPRLLPGLVVAGVGSGLLNAALPRLAVDSVPPERAAMGSGANNTARYIGSSAGVALTLALVPAGPDTALLVSAGLAVTGAALTLVLGGRRRER
ncbi:MULTISPECIES: MFS transporter [unclassified Streptomyces]|uniref:MFS transporter n=1 Tax=unclassified Streptomyces TaxID=2593676 RepID=UPI0006FCB07C|nr:MULTISPECIES: MFS transporter [unclassified Streptomyces]KQX53653.1 MFS transporter [Streptomyces sp. Root1304]KRA90571.1 MFS transporter [Streptomyces sp. Root66D1]